MCCVECSIIQAHFASECRVRVWYSVCGKTQPCCEGLHFASHWSTVDDEGLLHNGKPLRFKKHCGGEHIYVTCIPHSNLLPLSIRPNSIPIRTRKSSDRLSLDYRLQSMMTVCIYIYISIYLSAVYMFVTPLRSSASFPSRFDTCAGPMVHPPRQGQGRMAVLRTFGFSLRSWK